VWYLAGLSTAQLVALYVHERHPGPEGIPKLVAPPSGPAIDRKKLFRRRCYLLGVTDPATVETLWAEDEAKRAEKKAKREAQKRERRRAGPGQARP
jgi:hypothetical protein